MRVSKEQMKVIVTTMALTSSCRHRSPPQPLEGPWRGISPKAGRREFQRQPGVGIHSLMAYRTTDRESSRDCR
jgi:hypothetical protein